MSNNTPAPTPYSPVPLSAPPPKPRRREHLIEETTSYANAAENSHPSSPQPFSDPQLNKAVQLKSFERSFTVNSFISDLSEQLITNSKNSSGPFDPLPFAQMFSPALDSLLSLRQTVSGRLANLEEEAHIAENEYQARLGQLDGGFNTITSSFAALESKISGVGGTAVRMGGQLESLHRSRSTAQATSLLLSYYLSIGQQEPAGPIPIKLDKGGHTGENSQDAPKTLLDALFATRTTREGRARLATILKRLVTLAKEIADNSRKAVEQTKSRSASKNDSAKPDKATTSGDTKAVVELEKAERIRDIVEKYSERFEKECLRLFDKSYRKGDVRMMAHCARILLEFNGGTSCVQMYVNQHDFFISKDRVIEEAQAKSRDRSTEGDQGISGDIWETLHDPDASPPKAEPGLTALFNEIEVTVSQEAQIIQAVFPMKEEVMRVFLQRVFAQVIQQYFERLLSKAGGLGTLALLRMLKLTHSACSSLIDNLKQYELHPDVEPAPTVGLLESDAGSVTRTDGLSAQLDQYMDELFSPFLYGTKYIELESKWLNHGYADLLSSFVRYHETIIKSKPNTLLDRMVNQLSTTAGNTTSTTTYTAASAASAAASWLQKHGGNSSGSTAKARSSPGSSRAGTPVIGTKGTVSASGTAAETKIFEVDGVLSLERGEQLLRWHAEAISRAAELSSPTDFPKHIVSLARLLRDQYTKTQLDLALISLLTRLEHSDPKQPPEISSLSALRQANLLLYLWHQYSSTALIPLLNTSVTLRKEVIKGDDTAIAAVEKRVNEILQKFIDLSLAFLSAQLKRQKNNDYKPKNDDLSFARTTTEPCSACCEYLEELKDAATTSLSGKNREAFFTELGVAFHSLLLDHYKKFPVNPSGGLMLTKDLAAYQEVFSDMNIPALTDRFDMLRQLGNSFIVQPEVLKSYLTESHLGRLDARLLLPFLMQRSDWSTFSRRFAEETGFPSLIDDSSNINISSGSSSLAGAKDHIKNASRLSLGVGTAGMNRLREMLREIDHRAQNSGAIDTIQSRLKREP